MNWSEAVELARQGREEGYTFLYQQTYQKSYYIALRYLKQEDAALDVVQEAYIKAFNSLEQLQDSEKFAGWLSRIVATKALDELKKRKMTLFSQLQTDDEEITMEELMPDERAATQPELAIDKAETSRFVQEIIGTLSDEQRMCIMMFYIEEMSVREIAQILNVSENTVKSRLKYGRKNIEEKVLDMEKHGTKLYGIAPLPFFIYLLLKDSMSVQAAPMPLSSILEADAVSGKAEKPASDAASDAAPKESGASDVISKESAGGTMTSKAAAVTVKRAVIGIVAGAAVLGGATAAVYSLTHKNTEAVVEALQETQSQTETDFSTEDSIQAASETQTQKPEIVREKWQQAYIDFADGLQSDDNGYAVLKVAGSDIPILAVMPDVFDSEVDTTGWESYGFASVEEYIKAVKPVNMITEDSCTYPGAYPFRLYYYDTQSDEMKRILHSEGNNPSGISNDLMLYKDDVSMYLTYQQDKDMLVIDVTGLRVWGMVYSVNPETGNVHEEESYASGDIALVPQKDIIYYRTMNQALDNISAVQK